MDDVYDNTDQLTGAAYRSFLTNKLYAANGLMYDYAFECVLFDDRSSQHDQVADHKLVEPNDVLLG
ncbi:MAG: hypothetical protein LBJ67_01190 [Planctomycetaceae bacterium]|nr:hypothetical protein [Planctomycetaceae bacterium]